jgi:predicted RNA-binding protein YlqC (UPF0109 family)
VKRLLEALAQELVDDPGRVEVREREEGTILKLDLEVAPEDRGRVIGPRGRTAGALRTLLSAVAERSGRRCELEIR